MKKTQQKKSSFPANEKIKNYSALAGAFLLGGMSAQGAIVYTDVDPDETYNEHTDFYNLDLNNDGTVDFVIYIVDIAYSGVFSTSGGDSFSGLFQDVFLLPASGNSAAASTVAAGAYIYPYALNSGDAIDGTLSFRSESIQSMATYLAVVDFPVPGSNYVFFSYGNWQGGVYNKFLGLRFQDAGNTYYGWARLDCGPDHHSFTIKDYAYNSTPDAMIVAGEIPPPPIEISFTTDAVTVDEADGTVDITISITESADVHFNLDMNEALSTATNAVDFGFSDPMPLTFSVGGPTSQTITVDIYEDVFDEPDETIVFQIAFPVGAIPAEPDVITVTINDNDGPPGISFGTDAVSLTESATTVTGSVVIDVPSDCSIDVALNAGLSTATDGSDFNFTSPLTLNFTAGGAASLDFDVAILDDASVESAETIVFDLSTVTGTCFIDEPDQYIITIEDTDVLPAASTVSISEQHVSYNEDAGTVAGTVVLDATNDCNVDVILEGTGSATEGEDFTFSSPHAVAFTNGGATSIDFDIPITDDLAVEGTEIINFSLQNATGNCTIDAAASTMMLHIIDNDELGIHDQSGTGAIIYSFGNAVTIELLNTAWKSASANIFDNAGRNVFATELQNATNTIDLKQLPDGIYIVQLIVDGVAVEKNIYLGRK